MSSASDMVHLVKVKDSRLDIKEKIPFRVSSGPSQNTAQIISANSKSPSNVSWNVVVPNESTVISRKVYMDSEFTVTFNYPASVAATADVFQLGTLEAPAPFPFQSGFVENIQCFINNSSVSSPLSDLFHERWMTSLDEEKFGEMDGQCPSKEDDYKSYADALGKRNNPFSGYDGSGYGVKQRGRGIIEVMSVSGTMEAASGGAISRDVKFRSIEPIFIKPFLQQSGGQDEGLIGINSLNINLNMNAASKRFWSAYLPAGTFADFGAGITTTLKSVDKAELKFNYMTLSEFDKIPLRNTLPAEELTRYVSSISTLNDGSSAEVTSQNIQLGVVPSKIYICARRLLSSRNPTQSFSYFNHGSETPLRVTFDNKSNLLSNFSVAQLYEMSKRNGYERGYNNFLGYSGKDFGGTTLTVANVLTQLRLYTQGPVFVINPAQDLSLDARLSEGCTSNVNMQVSLNIKNNFGANVAGELVIIVENQGILTTVSGSTYVNSSIIDSRDVVQVKSTQKGYSSNEVQKAKGSNVSQSNSDALQSLIDLKGGGDSKMGSGASSGGAMSGGGARSGGKKRSELESLLY